MHWAESEFETADIGDKRLNTRLIDVAYDLGKSPSQSIPSACRGWQETKSTYRFFENAKVTARRILTPHLDATKERMSQHNEVLLLQDTTILDYSKHFSKQGIGFLNSEYHKGILMHPLYAVTENRLPLGLVEASWWAREELGQKVRSEERSIEDKESYRWLQHYRRANELAKEMPETHFTMVADQECDIYEVLQEAAEQSQSNTNSTDLLVRSNHNRSVIDAKGNKGKLRDMVRKTQPLGAIEFEVRGRSGQKNRQVRQLIRAKTVTLPPTQRRGGRGHMRPFTITVLHAFEPNPPKGSKAVEWFLLSTVDTAEDFELSCTMIKRYLARWEIEMYFDALKNGCKVEDIQLEEEQRFTACLALYMVIAWRVAYLSKLARVVPDMNCEEFLDEEEWRVAYVMIKKKKPKKTPTIQEAIRLIAQVGGYLARKSDGPPGMKNLWRGMRRVRQVALYKDIADKL